MHDYYSNSVPSEYGYVVVCSEIQQRYNERVFGMKLRVTRNMVIQNILLHDCGEQWVGRRGKANMTFPSLVQSTSVDSPRDIPP